MKYAVALLLLIAAIVAFAPGVSAGTWPFVGPAGASPTSTPSVVVHQWATVVCDACIPGGGGLPEMAATPTSLLIQTEDVNQEPSLSNLKCGVGNSCVPTKYISFLANACSTTQQVQVLTWAGMPLPSASPQSPQETAMQHMYPSNPTPEPGASPFRLVDQAAAAAKCAVYNASGGRAILFQPSNSAFLTELETAVWNQTSSDYYPAPYGVYEDNSKVLGAGITGGGSAAAPFSTEYSCGWNSGNPCAINVAGTGPFAVGTDYDTALGTFLNSANPLKMILNGGAPLAVPTPAVPMSCDIVVSAHCHDGFVTGDIDNNYETALHTTIVANTDANFLGFDLESPFFNHLTLGYCNVAQCDAMLNTFVNFQLGESGNSTKLYDLEPGYGLAGIGDLTGGLAVRRFALAAEWLVPNPTTGTPDRIVPRRLTIDLSSTETASYFELTGIPTGPEHAVQKYVWNGTTTTLGGGCPSAQGDTHGIIDLLAPSSCGTDGGGVYVQQYAHFFFNGIDYGKMAVVINTSATTTQTFASNWFTGDPISSYGSQLSLSGGEVTCVAWQGINDGDTTNCPVANNTAMRNCTNTAFCTGAQSVAGNITTFGGVGATIGPDSGMILMQTPVGPTPTPSPAPTPTPTPTPAPSPTPGALYKYCPAASPTHCVQVYNGTAASPDPIANFNVSGSSVDTNSANILTNNNFTLSGSSNASLERVNLVTSATCTLYTVMTNGGHNPPITSGPYGGGAGAQICWNSLFYFEGTHQGACSGNDCHWVVLDLTNNEVAQGYGGTFSGTAFGAYDGTIDGLNDTYTNNWVNKGDNTTVAGTPLLGFTLFGEDLLAAQAGTPINHPGDMIIPTSMLLSGTNGVNISHGVGNGGGTCAGAANCFELGDLLRLKPGFTCAGADAEANAWIVEMQQFGAYITDTAGSASIRTGLDTNGSDDATAHLLSCIHAATASNWDVITRGTVVP